MIRSNKSGKSGRRLSGAPVRPRASSKRRGWHRLPPVDAPVAKFVQRDRQSGDGATHEGRRAQDDSKIAVEKLDFGLARVSGPSLNPVHGEKSRFAVLCHGRRGVGTARLAGSKFMPRWTRRCTSGNSGATGRAFRRGGARPRFSPNLRSLEAQPQNTG